MLAVLLCDKYLSQLESKWLDCSSGVESGPQSPEEPVPGFCPYPAFHLTPLGPGIWTDASM